MFLALLVFLVGAGAVFVLFYALTDFPSRMADRRVQMRLDEFVRPGGNEEASDSSLINPAQAMSGYRLKDVTAAVTPSSTPGSGG